MSSLKSALTTDKLIASIKRRTMSPSSQITFKDEDLIEFLNEEMLIGIIPTIEQMKDEYLVYKQHVEIQPNVNKYPIPERALGNKLRELSYSTDLSDEFNMTQIELDNKSSNLYLNQSGFYCSQFYVQGAHIHLHPSTFSFTGYLNMYYYMRPNYLVKDSNVAVITSIDRTNGIITLNKIPSTYNTNLQYDFVKSRSPHNIMSIDLSIMSINQVTKTIQINTELIPSELAIGDYMPIAGESCIPNIPTELHAVLAQRVGLKVLESLGDTSGIANAEKKLQEMESKVGVLIDNRVEGAVRKVKNKTIQYTMVRGFRGIF